MVCCERCRRELTDVDDLHRKLGAVMEEKRPISLDVLIKAVSGNYNDVMMMSFAPRTMEEVELGFLVKNYRIVQMHTFYDKLTDKIQVTGEKNADLIKNLDLMRKLSADLFDMIDMSGVGKFKTDDEMLDQVYEILETKIDKKKLGSFVARVKKLL